MCLQLLGSPTTLHKTSLPGSSAKAGEDGPFATRPWRPGVAPRGSWPKTRSNLEIHFGSFWHFQAASTISNLRHANIPINIIQYPIYVYVYIYIPTYIPTFWFGAFPSDTLFLRSCFFEAQELLSRLEAEDFLRELETEEDTHHGSHGKVATFPNRNFL